MHISKIISKEQAVSASWSKDMRYKNKQCSDTDVYTYIQNKTLLDNLQAKRDITSIIVTQTETYQFGFNKDWFSMTHPIFWMDVYRQRLWIESCQCETK